MNTIQYNTMQCTFYVLKYVYLCVSLSFKDGTPPPLVFGIPGLNTALLVLILTVDMDATKSLPNKKYQHLTSEWYATILSPLLITMARRRGAGPSGGPPGEGGGGEGAGGGERHCGPPTRRYECKPLLPQPAKPRTIALGGAVLQRAFSPYCDSILPRTAVSVGTHCGHARCTVRARRLLLPGLHLLSVGVAVAPTPPPR